MKKRIFTTIIILIVVFLLAFVLYFFVFAKDNSDRVLSLDALKYNGEYQYTELEWGSSLSQVKRKLPFSITDFTEIEPYDEHYSTYRLENLFTLDGSSSVATLEFYDGKLQRISFSFQLNDNYMEWFDEQVAELTDLYGAETDKMENTFGQFHSIGYKWNTDASTLQIILVEGDVKPTVQIGVSVR